MEVKHPFRGRTLAIVNDFSLEEQWYLYQKTRELKEAITGGKNLDRFRLRNEEFAVYTIFMEDSTRTKESFRNAAEFHGMKVNVFDTKTSSFQKNETITDTIKMLCGYSIGQSIFVIRSKIEGVCRWLEEAIKEYTRGRGFPTSSFINAGDGRHEHPSQELLDEFSFLEHKGWDRDSIHLALLGDLFHGRTVHSKVDGLRLYSTVQVDLVAPAELALPKMYEDRMVAFGFTVRKFASIEEYLAQDDVAKIWYFTRLQLERMGDKVLDKSMSLRKAVTFQREFVGKLPRGTRFFHPLPRDARHPTLPFWLDNTELNGWDQQSQNGYFTRIILLGMLGGLFGDDFVPSFDREASEQLSPRPVTRVPSLSNAGDFIQEMKQDSHDQDSICREVGLVPLKSGIIIENLGMGQSVEKIWSLMYMVRSILGFHGMGGHGVYHSGTSPHEARGYISCPELDVNRWDRPLLKKLAAMAPGSILKVIEDGLVSKEYRLQVPPRIYNFPDISCKNVSCVSHPDNMQHEVPPHFLRASSRQTELSKPQQTWHFSCKYCEALHDFWQIWDDKSDEAVLDFTI
mmetsp:Transcript_46687/g.107925  ORF Transcript_46687/g.107925 Transcript_46687/m.107925 type:complete len:570 (+) Transcript_46687:59-1768(+)